MISNLIRKHLVTKAFSSAAKAATNAETKA